MVELVDSPASGAGARKGVRVRLPPRAPQALNRKIESLFFYKKSHADESLRGIFSQLFRPVRFLKAN